jgi:hypothetical protein
MFRSRTIAIAGSIAALTFAATPVAALAATSHHDGAQAARLDPSRDARGSRHLDRTVDRAHPDRSTDRSSDRSSDVRSR